ncbi:MAG: Rieske 2Fe-2S domain-containing protein [Chloroflexi bacterium]|nr:Rieske 2Fe-2S domain-containing protein [Chloroflexota bacterium]
MLTSDENDFLARVGPGTPGGEMLRRYWHPVATAKDLTDEQPTKFVRVLGEDLVLFKDKSGRVGLIGDKCPHRNASLVYGRVEERGISCAYHGWLMDCEGNIIETPPERNDAIMRNVKATAYPVQTFIGLLWAYMGPLPAPVIPHYDIWVRKDGRRKVTVRPRLDCNWLQPMENSADSAHLEILHQTSIGGDKQAVNTTRGFIDDVEMYQYHTTDWGALIKTRTYKNGKADAHPLIFPNILRVGDRTQIRVPMDDYHTHHFAVAFEPSPNGEIIEEDDLPTNVMEPFKDPVDALYPVAKFRIKEVPEQDYMAWETQGPLADRTKEHLSFADRGVVLYRKMLGESIQQVQRGEDPWGIQRDPDHATIDTNLDESLVWERVGRPAGINTETIGSTNDAP